MSKNEIIVSEKSEQNESELGINHINELIKEESTNTVKEDNYTDEEINQWHNGGPNEH